MGQKKKNGKWKVGGGMGMRGVGGGGGRDEVFGGGGDITKK